MRPITEIIVHCSATRPEWMERFPIEKKVEEIRRWHVQDRGWRDIGYHFLIDRNGKVAKGRPVEQVGAHVQGRNTGTIGVCLIGGHGSSEKDKFADHFTPAQDRALQKLLVDLMKAHPDARRISGHNQYAAKACPGFNVPSWYAESRAGVTSPPLTRPADHVTIPPKIEHEAVEDQLLASNPVDVNIPPKADDNVSIWARLVQILAKMWRR